MLFRSALLFLAILPAVLSGKSSKKSKGKGKHGVVKESVRFGPETQATRPFAFISVPQPNGPPIPVPTVPGSQLLQTRPLVGKADDPTYYYLLQCTILEGELAASPPGLDIQKQKCEIDVCLGINESSGEPDCYYLRFSGSLPLRTVFGTVSQADVVPPFKATVTGGSGKYLLATGQALVTQEVDESGIGVKVDIDLRYIPSPLAKVKRNGNQKLWD